MELNVNIHYQNGKPYRMTFKTKGIDGIMGMDCSDIEDILKSQDKQLVETFTNKLSEAEDKAIHIRTKWLTLCKKHPTTFFKGWEFERHEQMIDSSFRFWFKPIEEPDYSI